MASKARPLLLFYVACAAVTARKGDFGTGVALVQLRAEAYLNSPERGLRHGRGARAAFRAALAEVKAVDDFDLHHGARHPPPRSRRKRKNALERRPKDNLAQKQVLLQRKRKKTAKRIPFEDRRHRDVKAFAHVAYHEARNPAARSQHRRQQAPKWRPKFKHKHAPKQALSGNKRRKAGNKLSKKAAKQKHTKMLTRGKKRRKPGNKLSKKAAKQKQTKQFSRGTRHAVSDKPHIVIVLLDDLGWNGMGYNNADIKTPFMDDLAREGVTFDRFYSAPVCAPSRFSLLTGRRGWQSEAWGSANFDPKLPVGTSLEYIMLPAALKEAGYETHMVGKWHQGFHQEAYAPVQRGFDTFLGILGGDSDHFTQKPCASLCGNSAVYDLLGNNTPAFFTHGDGKLGDDRYRERAVHLIQTHDRHKPFFLYLSLQLPHKPYQVTEEYSNMYHFPDEDQNIFYGMITHCDDTVRAVVHALEENDMYTNTLLIVMSDNGAPYPDNAAQSKPGSAYIVPDGNFPLKNGKGSVFDGGIRTPAFVNGGFLPDKARGQTRSGIMSISDWYATLAHIAGASAPYAGPVEADSLNNWAYIVGDTQESKRKGLVEMAHRGKNGEMEVAVIKTIDGHFWKMVLGAAPDKCTHFKPCLYHLTDDPGEDNDLSDDQPVIFSVMKDIILEYVLAAQTSAWFGLHPDKLSGGHGWGERRDHFEPKLCNAIANAGGYVVPWADPADEEFNLENAKKNLFVD